MNFNQMVLKATSAEGEPGFEPYPYQQRLADEGLPEMLEVPTGAGKTLAAVLPWLYRRRFHPSDEVRRLTPHWLVVALPMRVLVEQTHSQVDSWLKNLGFGEEVCVHRVMGGDGKLASEWRLNPGRDAIFVGTIDMLLSRALNRGYGETRWVWPVDFGLFNSGCQWVFDEVQLMGPALPASLQLDALRESLGVARACCSMWMSATIDESRMTTVDRPAIASTGRLTDADMTGGLAGRLGASKIVRKLAADSATDKSYLASIADHVTRSHCPGTLTIAVLNTVANAVGLHKALVKVARAELVLVHSRFRPGDRAARVSSALAEVDPGGPGRIVVSTQVLEAGVDISAATLFTEVAPWPSVVQRAGRCNRDGLVADASLLWAMPRKSGPYDQADLDAAAVQLERLEGVAVTAGSLRDCDVKVLPAISSVLRRRDLIDLFDTTPDLSGNDIDISRFIRDSDDTDVQIAWHDLNGVAPAPDDPLPGRDERCSVPIGVLRDKKTRIAERLAWRFDHLAEVWVRCRPDDLRPGSVIVMDSSAGCYSPLVGWDPSSKQRVDPIESPDFDPIADEDNAVGSDPATVRQREWLSLARHLDDVETETARLLNHEGLSPGMVQAAITAARLHDIGKAHPEFQQMLHGCAAGPEEERRRDLAGAVLAKSGGSARGRNARRYFRHELASALALLDPTCPVLGDAAEPDLVCYLVAAHHGRVRVGFRSLPDEKPPPGEPERAVALGVWDGETLPAVELIDGSVIAETTLDLSTMSLGHSREGRPSWSGRMLKLRDRTDLGPFRLGYLEAIIRVADWRASRDARSSKEVD